MRKSGSVENVNQDRIEIAAVGGMVRAAPLPVVREQHVHRADAEIGRASAARFFAREREGREVADPLVATPRCPTPESVELGGDAEPFAQGGRRPISLGRRDGQPAFDAVEDKAMPPNRQFGQVNRSLRDAATVGEGAEGAGARFDAPLDNRSVLAFGSRVTPLRRVAQRGGERPIEAKHERRRQPAQAHLVDDVSQAFARLRLARGAKSER